jgi:hypothetical protein
VVRRTFCCKVGQASRVVDILRAFVCITKESGIPFTNQLAMSDLMGKRIGSSLLRPAQCMAVP